MRGRETVKKRRSRVCRKEGVILEEKEGVGRVLLG